MKSKIDAAQLWADILAADLKWTVDGTSVLMGNGQSAGIPANLMQLCRKAIYEAASFRQKQPRHVMINRLPPGVHVPVHTDKVLDDPERWHLPLLTNPKHCYHWDMKAGFRHLKIGMWHCVDYTIPHAIGNFGTKERVHLIVDLI